MPAQPSLPSDLRAPRQRRKGEVTRERILDAAEALFADRGFEGTALRDVAASVGLRTPSLYNHFEGKEDLYAAVLERGVAPVLRVLSESVARGGADSATLAARMMEILGARPNLPRLVQHETLAGGQRLTPLLRAWVAPVLARGQDAARQSGGAWPDEQIPHLVLAMYQVVVGYFTVAPLYRELSGDDLLATEALARQTRFLTELVGRLFPSADADLSR